jgi:hypothetical protein
MLQTLRDWWTRLTGGVRGAEPRSPRWPATRAAHLAREPTCQACGGKAKLTVHHILPVSWPGGKALELEQHNLITLCEAASHNCHLIWGHLLDWRSRNPDVRVDAPSYLAEVQARRYPPAAGGVAPNDTAR